MIHGFRICHQGVGGFGHQGGVWLDDSTINALMHEVLDARPRNRDHWPVTALGFGDGPVAPVGSGSAEENNIHCRIEIWQCLILISGPADSFGQAEMMGLFFQSSPEFAMTDDDDVGRVRQHRSSVEHEIEASSSCELAHRSNHWSVSRNPEAVTPLATVAGTEPVLERYRQGSDGNSRKHPRKISLESGVGEHCAGNPPVETTVVGISPETPRMAESSHQGNGSMHSGGKTQEVVVGEMGDDDVRFVGESFDGPDIASQLRGCSIFAEAGIGPFVAFESPFQIPPANEEKVCIDVGAAEGTAGQLGYGTGAGPFVGEHHETHSHRQSITKISKH